MKTFDGRSLGNLFAWFMVLTLVALIVGCGGGGGGGGGGATSGSGTLGVSLTDASCDAYKSVNVTISKVRVHQSATADENSAGWSDITLNPARRVDLLTLRNGVLQELGQTFLEAGHYTQLRLVLVPNGGGSFNNSVVLNDALGTEVALDTPSGVQTGIKVNHAFTVTADQLVEVTLDFDACRSVVARGNGTYLLKPVVRAVPKSIAGILGSVDPSMTNVSVSAQDGQGQVIKQTVPNSQGAFVLAPMDPGTYVVVVTAGDRATGVITGVTVSAEKTTRISSASDAILLPAPGMRTAPATGTVIATRTVNGSVNPAGARPATLRALQTPTGGLTIEIAYANSDTTAGAYSFPLPRLAPVVIAFSTPLAPFPATTVTAGGLYSIEASAAGYLTKVQSADISADVPDPVIVDFTLLTP